MDPDSLPAEPAGLRDQAHGLLHPGLATSREGQALATTSILLVSSSGNISRHSVEGARGCCLEDGLISMGHLLSADSSFLPPSQCHPHYGSQSDSLSTQWAGPEPSLLSCTGSRGQPSPEVSVPPTEELLPWLLPGDLLGAWNEIVVGKCRIWQSTKVRQQCHQRSAPITSSMIWG